jgi:hypothetical protein
MGRSFVRSGIGGSWRAEAAAVAAAVHALPPGPGSSGRGMGKSLGVRFSGYSFGSVRVGGVRYDYDLVIDRGKIRKRKKGPSRQFRGAYGHTRCRPPRISRGGAAGW